MGKFSRHEKKSNKLNDKAIEKRLYAEDTRNFTENKFDSYIKELEDDELRLIEDQSYKTAYKMRKKIEKLNSIKSDLEKEADKYEIKAENLEEKSVQEYVKGMHSKGLGKVVTAVALSGVMAASAGMLAIEGANYLMSNKEIERNLFKNQWSAWLDIRDFTRNEKVSEIHNNLQENVFEPVREGAKAVGDALAPVGDAVKDLFTINVDVVVPVDSMEK